jgi:hypothetical protein
MILIKTPTYNLGYVKITLPLRVWISVVDIALYIPLVVRITPSNRINPGNGFPTENSCFSFSKN